MANDARLHVVPPATGEPPRRKTLTDLALSINDVIPCTDATDRTTKAAALVSALSAAGLTAISASRPAWFHQSDTGHLWKYDGTNYVDFGAGGVQAFVAGSGVNVPTGTDYGVGTFTVTVGGAVVDNTVLDSLKFLKAGVVTMHVLFYLPINAQRAAWIGGSTKPSYAIVPGGLSTGAGGAFTLDRFSLSYGPIAVAAGSSLAFGWRQESGGTVNGCTCNVIGQFLPS